MQDFDFDRSRVVVVGRVVFHSLTFAYVIARAAQANAKVVQRVVEKMSCRHVRLSFQNFKMA